MASKTGPTYDPAAGTIRLGPNVDGENTAEWLVHPDNRGWGGFLAVSIGSGKSRLVRPLPEARDQA